MAENVKSPVIVTVGGFGAAAAEIAARFKLAAPKLGLIRIEGVCGAGKTNIARRLAPVIHGTRISGDDYADKYDEPRRYADCIRRDELTAALKAALRSCSPVVLEAICLDELAPIDECGRGLLVYVKQLSFNNRDPIWHDAIWLEEGPPQEEPHRSAHIYHANARPHERADLIIEIPQELHRLPSGGFSRNMCFDPPNSTVATPIS
jgi:hypothetical protein